VSVQIDEAWQQGVVGELQLRYIGVACTSFCGWQDGGDALAFDQ
jgi:hypothetical protein